MKQKFKLILCLAAIITSAWSCNSLSYSTSDSDDDLDDAYDDDTILIYDYSTLSSIGKNDNYPLDGEYLVIVQSLDLTNSDWKPIGSESAPFTGTFDGGGCVISGLNINATANGQGIFGYINGANVKNLIIKKPYITVTPSIQEGNTTNQALYTGAVVGHATWSSIDKCAVEGGVITSSGSYVGGVVGYTTDSSYISGCYSTATINISGSYAGGVVGATYSTTISSCYNKGSVSEVDTSQYIGGVVGAMSGGSYSKIRSSYNNGTIKGSSTTTGALVGAVLNSDASITECYYLDSADSTLEGVGENSCSGEVVKLTSLSELNLKVDDMNDAANNEYYTSDDTNGPTIEI